MAELLQPPFIVLMLGLLAVVAAVVWLAVRSFGLDRRTRGLVDGLEAERCKVAQIQAYLSQSPRQAAPRQPEPEPEPDLVEEAVDPRVAVANAYQARVQDAAEAAERRARERAWAEARQARAQAAVGSDPYVRIPRSQRAVAAQAAQEVSLSAEERRRRTSEAARASIRADKADAASRERLRQRAAQVRAAQEEDAYAASLAQDSLYGSQPAAAPAAGRVGRSRAAEGRAQQAAARQQDRGASSGAAYGQSGAYGSGAAAAQTPYEPGAARAARARQGASRQQQAAGYGAVSAQPTPGNYGRVSPAQSGFVSAASSVGQRKGSVAAASGYQSAVAQAGAPARGAEPAAKAAKGRPRRSKEMEIPRAPDQTHGIPLSEWPTDDAVLGQGGSTAAQRARQQAAARQAAQVRQAAQARQQGEYQAPSVQSPSQSGRLTPRAGRRPMASGSARGSEPVGDPIPVQVEAASSVGLLRRKRGASNR